MVRVISVVMLVLGIALMHFAIVNFSTLDLWLSIGAIAAGFGAMTAATTSLITGNPEWILLNLIIPG
jgi:hypothetical protein